MSIAIKESLSRSFIKLSNAFAFLDPEPPAINILYEWSGIYGHFLLWSSLFSFVISSKLNIFYVIKMKYKQYKNEFLGGKRSKRLLQELPFYNASIEKPYIKRLNKIDLLHELPFYNELNIVKISKAFRGYARSYRI